MMKTKLALIALFSAMSTGILFAQIPSTMSYQGVLTDANGNVVADDTYQLRFRLYQVQSGGTPLWDETQSVLVEHGLFNVILGVIIPLELPFIHEFWLGITINGGTELTPRTRLTSAPYSFNARMVAGGPNIFPVEGSVGIGITESSPATHLHVHGSPVQSRGQLSISAPPGEDTFISFYEGNNFKSYLWYDDNNDDLNLQNFNESNGGDLNLNPFGGNVGIGTNMPTEKLQVAGTIHSTSGGFKFPDGSVQTTAGGTGGDNLGNHTATQNINLSGHALVNGGIAHDLDLNMQSTRNLGISAGNDLNMQSGGKLGIAIGTDLHINAGRALNVQTGDSLAIKASTALNIEAVNEIAIRCGSALIVMKKNGDITIKGKNIRIEGSGSVTIKGQFIREN